VEQKSNFFVVYLPCTAKNAKFTNQ